MVIIIDLHYLVHQSACELGLKNVTKRNPVQETQESLAINQELYLSLTVYLGMTQS